MDTYTAHILFKLHDELTGAQFQAVKNKFHEYLENGQPVEAAELLEAAQGSSSRITNS